jgi:hypothetical protein
MIVKQSEGRNNVVIKTLPITRSEDKKKKRKAKTLGHIPDSTDVEVYSTDGEYLYVAWNKGTEVITGYIKSENAATRAVRQPKAIRIQTAQSFHSHRKALRAASQSARASTDSVGLYRRGYARTIKTLGLLCMVV